MLMTAKAFSPASGADKALRQLLTDAATYRAWAGDTVRWSDTDRLGHVNHLAIGAYLETGRAHFVTSIEEPGQIFVTANLTINFLRELHWPDPVRVGTAVSNIGTTSFELVQALFTGDLCVATGSATLVMIDGETRQPIPIPRCQRERLMQSAVEGHQPEN